MILYGLELEGFYTEDEAIRLPPKTYPTDGLPALVELRTVGGQSLRDSYAKLIALNLEYPHVNYQTPFHVFSREENAEIRRRHRDKGECDIQNLYGLSPKLLGNKTIASFQINVSNRLAMAYKDDKGVHHPDTFGLLDVPRIVRRLDNEFAGEIKASGRQRGEYAIKDGQRLEYRSLPNSVFSFDADEARSLLGRIKKAVEG